MLSVDKWIKKMWRGSSLTDSGVIVPFVTTWMNLEGILSEISQTKKDKLLYDLSYMWSPNKITKLIEKEIILMVTRGWE